jgi:tetratricopeptide (TPR) repeat protein
MSVIKNIYIIIFFFLLITVAPAKTSQTQELNLLFKKLSKTNNINIAESIEQKIWLIWHQHPKNINLTDKLKLGTELMNEGSYNYALKIFNNVIKTDPYWSEGWNKRATLLFLMREYERSLYDIEKVLKLESRHFGALIGRAQIFIELKQYRKAINNFKKAKKIYPSIKNNKIIPKLEMLIEGIDI